MGKNPSLKVHWLLDRGDVVRVYMSRSRIEKARTEVYAGTKI